MQLDKYTFFIDECLFLEYEGEILSFMPYEIDRFEPSGFVSKGGQFYPLLPETAEKLRVQFSPQKDFPPHRIFLRQEFGFPWKTFFFSLWPLYILFLFFLGFLFPLLWKKPIVETLAYFAVSLTCSLVFWAFLLLLLYELKRKKNFVVEGPYLLGRNHTGISVVRLKNVMDISPQYCFPWGKVYRVSDNQSFIIVDSIYQDMLPKIWGTIT